MGIVDDFATRMDDHLRRVTTRRGILGAPLVAVSAPELGLEYRFGDPAGRFHAASIGKAFTATLVMQLVEQGAFGVDTPIAALLPAHEFDGLFAEGADAPTVHHLLTHTSGAADYFDGPVTSGRGMRDLVVAEPDRLWTPADLLEFSRRRQRPVGRPGERFAYSDTGYVLLGRIVEEQAGLAFHEALHERILSPLGLRDTSMPFRSEAASGASDLRPFRLGRHEVSGSRSISCAWSGGGIVSTPDDLVAFSRALHAGRLISPEHVGYLAEPRHRFRVGLRYGAGHMQVRFGGFSPFLAGLPRPVGHLGVLATHLWHDPVHDAEIVLDFASTREMTRSFRTLIRIEQELGRVRRAAVGGGVAAGAPEPVRSAAA
ncbi:serine hydrolase domain-containing protein [Agromyces sp. MMS24-JH15]|uniref:serine hydrolase domain-containing protein n=1 Tax=Agromyces sp. MMS24-JH15 TaxID=3243765 RepID=UPI003749D259